MSRVSFSAVLIVLVGTIAAACGSNNSADGKGDGDGGAAPDTSGAFNNDDGGTGTGNCKPLTCADQGIECGPAGDGCGGVIQDCGQCAAGLRCGGPGAFSKCVSPTLVDGGVCTPKACADQNIQCGPAGDGCGGVIDCGTCQPGFQCGADNAYSQCVSTSPTGPDGGACVPKTQANLIAEGLGCGIQSDGCGGTVDLGGCTPPQFCGGAGPSKCGVPTNNPDGGACVPKTCGDYAAQGVNCGVHPDGCGGMTASCGSCTFPQVCGGGGVASQCGGGSVVGGDGGTCTPIPQATACAGKCGVVANGCGGTINCGTTCPTGQTCGGGGTANVCGAPSCNPIAQATACSGKDCGTVANGCGGTYTCGTGGCNAPAICGGGGVPNKCGGGVVVGADGGACTPQGCGAKNCGQIANGCGGLTASCGTCTLPGQTCGGGGVPNVCGGAGACTPLTFAQACTNAGKNCGPVADGCGGIVNCGTCTGGAQCGAGNPGTPNVCSGTPGSCPAGAQYLCNSKPTTCGASNTTKITGRVYAPNGSLPIYDALVWIPKQTGSLAAITTGASCDSCNVQVPALVYDNTDYKGDFELNDVPAGTDIPLVIQVGKWRREIRITVTACQTNNITCDPTTSNGRRDCPTRLARYMTENVAAVNDVVASNNIPKMAVTTGGADTLQCLLRKIGVDDREFTHPTQSGRINLFQGSGGSRRYQDNFNGYTTTGGNNTYTGGATNRNLPYISANLTANVQTMMGYDALILSCEGNNDNGSGYNPSYAGDRQNMVDYADAGGRVFASHWQHSWLHKSTNASWVGAATWNHEEDLKEPIDATIDMGFTKGDAMARWLHFARNNTGTLGIISIDDAQHTIDAVNASVAKSWITIANPIEEDDDTTSASIQYFTMNTPTNVAPASQCGRVVVSDLHLSPNASDNDGTASRDDVDADFPAGCTSTNFLDQQKLLAFMLFDLTACIQPDQTPSCNALTCQQQGFNCGRAGDGCGNEIVGGCGTCQNGQICGYGGNANVCGGPTCTPIAACPPGYTCGQYPNGCGGLINCGTCTVPGQTCGGGGVANQCGAPVCQTKTCAQLNVSCGDTTNGCSGTQNCGNCVPGTTTCGGGGTAGVCGAPPCTKKTCAPNQCGSMPDGCGGVLTCNPCPQGQTCGGGGQANVCGTASCSAKSCAQVGATCGQASDGCGGVTANCGTCPVGQVCFNNVCSTPQCTPTTCAAQGVACGPLADGCGGLLQCGPCANGQTCGGGGVPGQCGGPTCTARTCAELGATCGQVADGCGGLTPNCGSCPGTQVCNNGVCQTACAPRTCAEANANCGSVADGCGGLLDCGPCTVPGQTCGGGGVPNQCGSGGVIK